jgi:hypothetical protein
MRSTSLGLAAVVALTVAVPLAAEASDFTGQIRTLEYGAAKDRVGIEVGPHGSPCAGAPDWFSVEGKPLWIDALFEALVRKRTVTLYGEACDSFNVESLRGFDIK